jgi:hypothetical protein
MHLQDGSCGDQQILSAKSVEFMRINRAGDLGVDYAMGWWITPGDDDTSTIY